MYKGTIIENSLRDATILKELNVARTWQSGDWTLHDVNVGAEQLSRIAEYLAEGPWYVHFWEPGKDEVIVVFKDQTFRIKFSDKTTWAEAVAYGRSIGIPEEQLDFPIGETEEAVIERMKSEGYDNVYAYTAEPGEVDEEHHHDFDTKLYVMSGKIRIKILVGGALTDFALKEGDEKEIPRGQKHSAVVGTEGCRYVVAERH
jgi:quercetin dioxygenase-like cupin family protein